jgi:hypothetical protein
MSGILRDSVLSESKSVQTNNIVDDKFDNINSDDECSEVLSSF